MSWPNRPIPVFPLPNCVVLPGALQGLHIFEQRYRDMISDESDEPAGTRYIAIALLKDDYESSYYGHNAPIHPVVCAGEIIKLEWRPDGRSDMLLLGRGRARVVSEDHDRSYRRGRLEPVETINDLLPDEETEMRRLLADVLCGLPTELAQVAGQIVSHQPQLEQAVDLLTYHVLSPESVPAKQMILSEPRLDLRVKMLVTLLERKHFCRHAVPAHHDWNPPSPQN